MVPSSCTAEGTAEGWALLTATREAALANPISYVPPSKKDEILAYTVQRIYAVCQPITRTSGNGQTNHWTLTFDVGEGKSVGMDVQPNPQQPHTNGGDKAHVIVSLLDYLITIEAERCDAVSVTHGRTVGWYTDYLSTDGRFKYAFSPDGIGCRKWVTDILQLLADIGEVDKSQAESAGNAIAYLWPAGTYSAPTSGTYFD
ncbi:hypothetical protein J1614_011164 [Plenodomus biglobosus]|nr:hypothetical protein J1614_011164 [Plenodomus biglobosus]